jgi:hypothetical protein
MADEVEDSYSYRGWMNSDSILKRAIGVWLYAMAGGLIVWFTVMFLLVVVAFVLGFIVGMLI